MLEKYFQVARISFYRSFAYRTDALMSLFSSALSLIMYFFVWKAITASGVVATSLTEIMTYYILAQVVQNTAFINVEEYLGPKIRHGTIVNELKRPLAVISQTYFHEVGESGFNLVTKSLPVAFAGALFVDLSFNPITGLLFLLSLFMSFNLVFLLSYTTSMMIFWTKVEWAIRGSRNHVQKLLSGVVFPLFLVPDSFRIVFQVLPFQAIVDGPIRIFTDASLSQSLSVLLNQVFWILVLFVVAHFSWRKARKKLTVQGG